jgi:hypothetical protein
MWILMYVFSYSVSPAATNDMAEWRLLLPTVVFQEFSNEERCRTAKSTLEGSLKEAGAKLKSGLGDLKTIGKADPAQIIIAFNAECLAEIEIKSAATTTPSSPRRDRRQAGRRTGDR